MKKTDKLISYMLTAFSALIFIFSAVSCSDDDNKGYDPLANLSVSTEQVNIKGDASNEESVAVTTNQKKWTVEADQEWCIVEETEKEIIIMADGANDSENSRKAFVTITVGEGTNIKTASILVVQESIYETRTSYMVDIPDFGSSYIYEVRDATENLIGQLCKEYLSSGQEIVFYPANQETQKASFASGYVMSNGGTVTLSGGVLEYLPGTVSPITTTFYINEGGTIGSKPLGKVINVDVTPKYLADKRGDETVNYKIVKIGSQIWIAENLQATKFNDGTDIPTGMSVSGWQSTNDPAVCAVGENDATKESQYKKSLGLLYNGFAVNTGKLAPVGWHVSKLKDWNVMLKYVLDKELAETPSGNNYIPGGMGKFKTTGTELWGGIMQDLGSDTPVNAGATNETGLSLVPCGYRHPSASHDPLYHQGFFSFGANAYLYIDNVIDEGKTCDLYISNNSETMGYAQEPNRTGKGLRILMDIAE